MVEMMTPPPFPTHTRTHKTTNCFNKHPVFFFCPKTSKTFEYFFCGRFIPEISEAFPEVPWVFVFRDPVEVMVSNLKSFTGAPCVRIPRQEKMRKAGKGGPKSPPVKNRRPGVTRGKFPGNRRGLQGGRGGAEMGVGVVGYQDAVSSPDMDINALSRGGEGGQGGVSGGAGGSRGEVFEESVSWNGFTDGGFDSFGVPFSGMVLGGDGEGEWGGGDGRRSLKPIGASKFKLSANMTTECADWLKVRDD